jgi:heme/copper-type cytochrome/quinol oxidase subunit 2
LRTTRFGLLLLIVAASTWALLWWLGYWIIAFAVGIAVLVLGGTVYAAARAGSTTGRGHPRVVP